MASLVAGRAIRDMRRELGVTQAELARRLGISAPYVSALESGRGNPTVGHLWAIADALGVELHLTFEQPASHALPSIPPPPQPEQEPSRPRRAVATR